MRSKVFRLFALLVIFSMIASPLTAPAIAQDSGPSKLVLEEASIDSFNYAPAGGFKAEVREERGAQGPEIYLIRLKDEPVATYNGDLNNLPATSPAVTGSRGVDLNSPAVVNYTSYLDNQRAEFLRATQYSLQRSPEVVYEYRYANNGVAMVLTPEEARKVAELPGVISVQRDVERELHTDAGPDWIGAPGLWDGSTTPGGTGSMGEGVVIGIIDTGINYSNPSFAEVGPEDGYEHINPLGSGNFLGACAEGQPYAHYCNDKLIGVRGYPSVGGGNPVDMNGHGSHVAGTAAGNFVLATVSTTEMTAMISGVAPHANLIAYNACCTVSGLSAAIDDIVLDYATILQSNPAARMAVNYSIGSAAPSDIWNDFDTIGYLSARAAGIFVATSAGNNGPGADTVGSPADAPWLTSVGNLTHNRTFGNDLINMGGASGAPDDMYGRAISAPYGPAPVLYAGDFGDPLCPIGAFPPGTFDGEIVVCDRGAYALVDKAQSVANGGAGGFVVVNSTPSIDTRFAISYVIPGVHLSLADGQVLKAWLATGEQGSHMAEISGSYRVLDNTIGDIMSSTSSRGANRALPEILVPSVSAPGSDILAPYGTNNAIYWDAISGTSMASPHVTGSAALLMALHPDWTPAEVQSALMTTSFEGVRNQDGVTPSGPFDMGSGRIDLTKASKAGLVMHETVANYMGANPADGGDPKTLNLASMGNASCLETCTWTRTVRATVDGTWTASGSAQAGMVLDVSPATFTLNTGETQEIVVSATVSGMPVGQWAFGKVTLTPDDESVPAAHLPVGVVPTRGVIPASVDIVTRRDAGAKVIEGIESIAITDLTVEVFGLVPGIKTEEELFQDPTNGNPYNDDGGTFFITMEVQEGAKWLIAEILSTTAPDLDLFVGMGDTPSAATQVCASTSGTSAEYCKVVNPTPGTWWVLVQNWNGSENQPDPVVLSSVVIYDTDAGNMYIEGPQSVPQLTPFDVILFWNEPAMDAGEKWYGAFSLGSDPAHPGNIGTIPVSILRVDDDVVKTADREVVEPGDIVTYQIMVRSNITPEDLTYTIQDTLPSGLTYVPGSATATDGEVTVENGVVSWTGVMEAPTPRYDMNTSLQDPTCAVPLANSGAYLNLAAFGIAPNPAVSGDTVGFTAFSSGSPFIFWGAPYTGITFRDDGFAYFNSSPGNSPWINEDIPNPADPNNLLAMYWNDWEIIYNAAAGRGVSLASLGGTGDAGGIVIEYDDVQIYQTPDQTLDFQIFIWRTPDPSQGTHDIVFAYDNLNLDPEWGTIGIENATGTAGVKYAFDDDALFTIQDGMAICFDWYIPSGESVLITYQATVDEDASGALTNEAVHDTDALGSLPAVASATVYMAEPPTAGFTYEVPVFEKVAVDFTNTSTGIQPISYAWDFGDGGSSTEKHPTYTFEAAGAYTVTLTATNEYGSDTYSELVVVAPALPETDLQVEITISPLPVYIGRPTTFTAVVSNNGTQPATGVVVSGEMPANVEFVEGTLCEVVDGDLVCDLGTIDAGASKTAVVVLKFTAAGAFELSLDLGATGIEPVASLVEVEVLDFQIFAPIIRRGQ